MSEPVDPREQFGEHAEWDALAVGWALSALDPVDEEVFAAHMPGCARCTATVREALYTVADLAYALPDEAPPASLKARIMAAVAAEPRAPGAVSPEAAPVVEPEAAGEEWPAGAAAPGVRPEEAGEEWPAGAAAPGVRPEEAGEEWPPAEPYAGSPGEGIDWFAKPPRSALQLPPAVPTTAPTEPRRRNPFDEGADADPWVAGDKPAPAEGVAEEEPPGADSWVAGDRPATDEGVAEKEPPAADERVAEDERAVRDMPVGGDRAAKHEPPVDGEPSPYGDGEIQPVRLASRRRRLARTAGIGVAAAAVLALIAGLLVSNARLRDQESDLRRVVAERDAAIAQFTANGPAKVAALTANGQPSPDRRATLVVRGDHLEIIIESLGPTTGDETYWLWTLRCDTPQPTDLRPIRGFTVPQPEFSVRDIGSDPAVAGAPCFAISAEQGTATPKAPRQVVAVGQAR